MKVNSPNLYLQYFKTGREGHWVVNYTSTQSFMITFPYLLTEQLWGLLLNCVGWFTMGQYLNLSITNCNVHW